jgi:protein-glutamine gamma-glutamyltransferase
MPIARTNSESQAITKVQVCLESSLFLMTLTGFLTLASTGGLDRAALILVLGALLIRGLLLLTGRSLLISESTMTLLTVVCAVFYVADLFLLRSGFLTATVRLVVFVMVVRIVSARRDRDYYFLAAVAFLMVLAGAVLTVDSTFLFGFVVFLLAASATFILMEMKHAAQASGRVISQARDETSWKGLTRAIGFAAVLLVLGTMIGGAGIFFLLPRTSAGYLSAYSPTNEIATGFSDSVQLGRIGEIQQSHIPIMHIQVEGDRSGTLQVKWRGVTLSNFDGKTWSHSHAQRIVGATDGGFSFWPSAPLGQQKLIRYRVLMEPVGNNVFFLAPAPQTLKGDYRLIALNTGEAISNADSSHMVNWYQATSDIATPSADQLRSAGEEYPPPLATHYRQLPRLDPRISLLAQEITGGASNNYDRALLLETYLRTHYSYTLQLSRRTPQDPLAEFLFERKQGHCEYFASSMAVLLRIVGIPSRVVNGFQTGEFNDVSAEYIVRASDAHSWVEAYFPGSGWVSFDPTPGGAVTSHTRWNRALLYLDALHEFWRQWVVNYDASHQASLAVNAQNKGEGLLRSVRQWYHAHYRKLLDLARLTEHKLTASPLRWILRVLLAAAAAAFLFYVRRILKLVTQIWIAARPEKAPTHAASIWYERLVRKLAHHGLRKSPVQTPHEFLALIRNRPLQAKVTEFTKHYENARFGDSPTDAQRLPVLYEEIRRFRKEKFRRGQS